MAEPVKFDQFIRPLFDLSGRTAFVTGGAMSMGQAIAVALARLGADVAIHTCKAIDASNGMADAADKVAGEIAALGRRTAVIDADFSQPSEGERAARDAIRAMSRIDIVVICASIQDRRPISAIETQINSRQIAANLQSTLEMTPPLFDAMVSHGWGRLLSIGSVNQARPDPDIAIYAACKAAQHNLILSWARVGAAHGVTANTLSPGLIATERNRWRRADAADWEKIQEQANPMGRAGDPRDVVGATLLLCSDAGRFITGIDLPVDGGARL